MTLIQAFGRITGLSAGQRTSVADIIALMRQRNDLRKLTPSQLHDIGLTEADVTKELQRSVFDVPNYWHR
ncbi:DUF1127 domain-containing protein [Cognatishimia sp. SS12]|uniref:DUF1127 domain-containing protein n=1 Tax=Cognatishimia sp. SS12 TaxID=2979465 RepID=UPI00232FF046|nr:DUF1127 domain-containing protein [Cognatishimia sp. SS12]MDC0738621.1 DUF1127 domain-containing protein [Cognatishimia sp. SS12]